MTAGTHTGCLVLLQQGKADAITGDDTVLAGLAAQDPNTVVTSAKAITVEPYGLGVNKADVYLARYAQPGHRRPRGRRRVEGDLQPLARRTARARARTPDPGLRTMSAVPQSHPRPGHRRPDGARARSACPSRPARPRRT